MKTVSLRSIWWLSTLALVLTAGAVYAAEHREHPGRTHAEEHPAEHPGTAAITPDEIAKTITGFVTADSKLKGGYFVIYDAKKKEPLALTLVRIHKDKITKLSDDLSFVCADFRTPAGKMYDLDFYVSHPEGRNMHVSEITIHKEAGVPRYNWVKEGGKWIRK
jgi:hypothetical protein